MVWKYETTGTYYKSKEEVDEEMQRGEGEQSDKKEMDEEESECMHAYACILINCLHEVYTNIL